MGAIQGIDRLRGLIEFVATVQAGSFSAASRTLGVSVAHVSRAVRDLENHVGVQLIHRTTRESTLTEIGREYFEQCKSFLEGLDETRERIQSGQSTVRGPIRISMGGFFAETRLGPLLARFALDHPLVDLDIDLNNHNVSLPTGGVDLAIRAGPLEASGLIARRLIGFPFTTLASPRLLEKIGIVDHPDALDPVLCLSLGNRQWAFRNGKEAVVVQPRGRFRANAGNLLIAAAVAGTGIVQVPAYYGQNELAEGLLTPILEPWTQNAEQFEFLIVYPPQRHLPMRVRALIDFLTSSFRR
jgi:DNA-binding transcriptional LysR family regulator